MSESALTAGRIQVRVDGREAVFGAGLPEIVVGSDRDCPIRPRGEGVARRHLVLRHDDGRWHVERLEAGGPVFLAGEPVERVHVDRPLELRLGDPHAGARLAIAPAVHDELAIETTDWGSAERDTPSTDGGPAASFLLTGGSLRIGRDPSGDVVVDDLLASRHHAEIRPLGEGRYEVVDLASHNGTFVNGRRVTRTPLEQRDVIMVGRNSYRLLGRRLEEFVDTGEVAFAASGLTVRLHGGRLLLDGVSFSLDSSALLAVVGPSGAGKSVLMNALTGVRMAGEGDVLYDHQSLYAAYDALRHRVGYVPQDDVLHESLEVRRALEWAADIRFPADVDDADRRRRVEEVLGELGLEHRATTRIGDLSGGQRKRVSLAAELLTEPSLLFLDEPTSGLDPHYERSLMQLFRGLADGGRTIVVATHSTQSLRLCDRLLVLAPEGRMAFFGPPQLVASYFDRGELAEVFTDLSERGEEDWGERFREHPYYREYVDREGALELVPPAAPAPARSLSSRSRFKQFVTLTRRYAAVIAGDRRNLALLLLQAPLLGALMLVALPSGELAPAPASQLRLVSQAGLVLLIVVLGITWLGMSNAVREIAKELPIFRRERAAGLSIAAYLGSKVAVLSAVTALQAVVIVILATRRQHGPRYAAVLGWPLGELLVIAIAAGVVAMTLGLLVSVLARTPDRAITVLPIVLIFQLVLSLGGVFPKVADTPGLRQLGYVAATRWAFAGAASTVDLNDLQAVTGVLTRVPSVRVDDPSRLFREFDRGPQGDRLWDHTAGAWLADLGALIALGSGALLVAGLALRREDAGRRRA